MAIGRRKGSKKAKADAEWLNQRDVESKVLAKAAQSFSLESILGELGLSFELNGARLVEFLVYVQGKFAALDALREALSEMSDFANWKTGDFLAARSEDRLPTLDEVIDWKKLNRIEVAGGLAAAAWTCGVDNGRAILGAAMPEVIRAAVRVATEGEGMTAHLSQKLLFEAGGMLPKGPNTIVNVNQQNNVVTGLPQWSEVDKVVEKAYFPKEMQKGLPPANMQNVIDAEVEEVEIGDFHEPVPVTNL